MKGSITTVKVDNGLYESFKIQNIKSKFHLQDLVNRAMYLYLNDKEFKDYEPIAQITSPLHTTEFIITSNKMIFPVRPSSIIMELPVYDSLEYFDLIEIKKSEKILESLSLFNTKTNNHYNYNPVGLVVTEIDPETVIGIVLDNEGLIPIYPTSVETMLETCDSLKLKVNIVVKNIYYEADYKIYDNKILKDDRIGYLEEYQKFEKLYQHFKYEVSAVLGESKYSSYKKEILELFKSPSIDLDIAMTSIKNIINKISNKILNITTTTKKEDKYGEDDDIIEKNKISKGIGYFHCDKITIENHDNAPLHLDGEPITTGTKIEIKIIPSAFKLLQPC